MPHSDGIHGAFHAFVAQSASASCAGLVDVVVGQHAEDHWRKALFPGPYVERSDALRHGRTDVFEMRGLSPDDASQHDQRVVLPGCLQSRGGVDQLEAAGYVPAADVCLGYPQFAQRFKRSAVQVFGDLAVPAGYRNAYAQAGSVGNLDEIVSRKIGCGHAREGIGKENDLLEILPQYYDVLDKDEKDAFLACIQDIPSNESKKVKIQGSKQSYELYVINNSSEVKLLENQVESSKKTLQVRLANEVNGMPMAMAREKKFAIRFTRDGKNYVQINVGYQMI